MSEYTIVTEGVVEIELLHAILRRQQVGPRVRFMAAGNWSSADSLARSLLLRGVDKVALVIDADSNDETACRERESFLMQSLGSVSPDYRWRVFVILPEVEVWLFSDNRIVEHLAGRHITEDELVLGKYAPTQALNRILGLDNVTRAIHERLNEADLDRIREIREVRELISFVTPGRRTR